MMRDPALLEWRDKPARKSPEADLQKAIWQHILIRGNHNAIAYAVPNGESRSKRTGAKLKAQGVVAGVFDLMFILPDGRAAAMELKALGGRLSPEQKAFAARLAAIGVEHCVCFDIDTAISVLEAWQVLLPAV